MSLAVAAAWESKAKHMQPREHHGSWDTGLPLQGRWLRYAFVILVASLVVYHWPVEAHVHGLTWEVITVGDKLNHGEGGCRIEE